MSHTLGPWKVVKPMHGQAGKYRCVQIGTDEMYTTLELLPDDARLIAAAPDLLKACEANLAAFEGKHYDPKAFAVAAKLCRAAIAKAKAKGRQP